ncbi:MAG: RIO1 family regulatory kinase/ATPase, partial [Pseudohongiella sp.]
MKTPARLQPLMDDGLIDEVVSQLMSGKEAQVYVVRCGTKLRCAKIYKEASNRSFKQAATYQEGRKVRNSRDARAMGRRSKYGQRGHEEAWLNAEVDALRRLHLADVRVPKTHGFVDGVLLMDMIVDGAGDVAPRLNDVELTHEEALLYHARIMDDVVKMLSVGLIHGDLSEFNVLLADDGPVI